MKNKSTDNNADKNRDKAATAIRVSHASEILLEFPQGARKHLLGNDRFVFAAYGCALTERQTPSGAYVYTAINLTTGAKGALSRRKNPLAEKDFEVMAGRIATSPVGGDSFWLVDKTPDEALYGGGGYGKTASGVDGGINSVSKENVNNAGGGDITDGTNSINSYNNITTKNNRLHNIANHIFTDILPIHGYAVRNKQIELTGHMLEVIKRRGISLAESEVGTGKTHAYLIAAALAKRGRLNDFWLRGHYQGNQPQHNQHNNQQHNKHIHQSWAESAHMPVVISTSSIALQQAILEDYIPKLSNILMQHGIIRTPLTAVIRKGKEHYICEKRLNAYHAATDPQTRERLAPFLDNKGSSKLGNNENGKLDNKNSSRNNVKNDRKISDAPFDLTSVDTLTPYMKKRIWVLGGCGENCKYYDKCRYAAYIKKANNPKVDFQITNHNYFLADTLHRASGRRPLLPHCQLVIVDEAHKFLQAARSMYGLELTDKEVSTLAREVHAITIGKSSSGVNVHRLAKKLEEQGERLMEALNADVPADGLDDEAERFPVMMGEVDGVSDAGRVGRSVSGGNSTHPNRYLSNIFNITGDLAVAISDSRVHDINKERKSNLIWRLGSLGEKLSKLRQHNRLIYWLEKRVEGQTKTDALCAIPKDLDERLYDDLWSNGIPIILTSGTLSASGDFTRAKQTLGLNHLLPHKLHTTTMPSPFDYKNNTLLYISDKVPFPNIKDKHYITAVADEIERLVIASHGRAAVLFTSYNAMGQVHAILKKRRDEGGLCIEGRSPFPLFRLERGGTHAIEQFKQSGNGILLASGALWEGIDIPGDALSMLIIVKLPFAAPDPIGDYERSQYGDMQTFKNKVIIPDMQVKLKQGDGRLVRSEGDMGVVAILDIRASERGAYHNHMLAALPEREITSDIEAICQFFLDKKSQKYFE